MTVAEGTVEVAARVVGDPARFTADLIAWLPDAAGEEVALTRHQLVDVAGYVKRHNKAGFLAALRAARITEWEMAHRWPANESGHYRTDGRPALTAVNADDMVLWQRVYAVGRADRSRILTETDPGQLTQAAVIRWTQPPPGPAPDVRIGDAREVLADVADDTVDLILTDPPYGDAARELYTWLGGYAARVLKPGGSLCVLTGQSRLPDDLRRLEAPGLRYWWTFSFIHDTSQRLPGLFVMVGWKPVLWFVKDHRAGREMVGDVLRGQAYPKDDHVWAQGDGVRPIIERLCPEGGLIVDPFAGTGQWGDLSRTLGRTWIGADAGGTRVVA